MAHWEKLGCLYTLEPRRHPKLNSHTANPLAVPLGGDMFRVFYSARDAMNRSSVGAVDIDIARRKVIEDYAKPFFEFGEANSFFSEGVSIANWYEASDGQRYILFMGWKFPTGEHWYGQIGQLALAADNTLSLAQDTPVMALDQEDPISLSYPWVMKADQGFRMFYGSTETWDGGNGEMIHTIKSAVSRDGQTWQRTGLAVPYKLGVAQAFSRPSVVQETDGIFSMWFSYRSGSGQTYRIGYAHSRDGNNWDLDLASAGIDVSHTGWDSEMIEYPFVFDHREERYMLYNGNGFGKSGFGLARLCA